MDVSVSLCLTASLCLSLYISVFLSLCLSRLLSIYVFIRSWHVLSVLLYPIIVCVTSIQLHRQTSDPSSYKKSSAPKLYFDVSLKSMRECMWLIVTSRDLSWSLGRWLSLIMSSNIYIAPLQSVKHMLPFQYLTKIHKIYRALDVSIVQLFAFVKWRKCPGH